MSEQCPACPAEVRALYAAAYNFCGATNRALKGADSAQRAWRKFYDLEKQVKLFTAIVEAHFADRVHFDKALDSVK